MMADGDAIVKAAKELVEHLRETESDMGEAQLTDDQGQPAGLVLICVDPALAANLGQILAQWQQGLQERGDLTVEEH